MMIPIRYNLRSLAVRKATTAATAFGIALVVFVLASALMLSQGIKKTLSSAGRADVAIVLRKGSDAEMGSNIAEPQINLIKSMPGVKRDGNKSLGAGEAVIVIALPKLGVDGVANVQVRGITEDSKWLRPQIKVVEGRLPAAGADEVMVGRSIAGRFLGVDLDQSFELKKNRSLRVVGIFEDGGSSHESEVWVDLEILRSSFGRQGSVSSVRVVLDSTGSFEAFREAVEHDKRLGLAAMPETTYYEKQSQGTSLFISVLGSLIAFFVSLGAMIGASITMYSSIANRQREIGTLRALGFGRVAILFSFLMESMALALIGGVVGAALSLLMSQAKFSMVNYSSWSEMVFSFEPTVDIMVTSLGASLGMGVLGGFLPALRAARVSPLTAMRG